MPNFEKTVSTEQSVQDQITSHEINSAELNEVNMKAREINKEFKSKKNALLQEMNADELLSKLNKDTLEMLAWFLAMQWYEGKLEEFSNTIESDTAAMVGLSHDDIYQLGSWKARVYFDWLTKEEQDDLDQNHSEAGLLTIENALKRSREIGAKNGIRNLYAEAQE